MKRSFSLFIFSFFATLTLAAAAGAFWAVNLGMQESGIPGIPAVSLWAKAIFEQILA
jgi:hypothetical protein